MCPRRMVPLSFFISFGILSVSISYTTVNNNFDWESFLLLTPFHSLSRTHGPCYGCLWRNDMRVEDDSGCCNGRSSKENNGKKGVEEHDQESKNYKR